MPPISLPPYIDYSAVFLFSVTGAVSAIRRHYDWVGLWVLALCSGLGGALLRDGLFIQDGPPVVLKNANYLIAVTAGCIAAALLHRVVDKMGRLFLFADALGLGAYGVVGTTKAYTAGLSIPASIFVGVVNAVGGSLIRDVLVNVEPLLFKPGQFYVVAALLGCSAYVVMATGWHQPVHISALVAIGVTFLARVLSITFNWKTGAILPQEPGPKTDDGREN